MAGQYEDANAYYNTMLVRYEKGTGNPDPAEPVVYGEDDWAHQQAVEMALAPAPGGTGSCVYVVALEHWPLLTPERTDMLTLRFKPEEQTGEPIFDYRRCRTLGVTTGSADAIAVDPEGNAFSVGQRLGATGFPMTCAAYNQWSFPTWLVDYTLCHPTDVVVTPDKIAVVGGTTVNPGGSDVFLMVLTGAIRPVAWQGRLDFPGGPKYKMVKDGAGLAYLPGPTNDYVYSIKGNNTVEFYCYNACDMEWTKLDSIPVIGSTGRKKRVKKGGTLGAADGSVYATKGNGTVEFWKFDPTAPAGLYPWEEVAEVPDGESGKKPGAGVGIALVPDGEERFLYFLKGNSTNEFYAYDPDGDDWNEDLPPAPLGVSGKGYKAGSGIVADTNSGNPTVYVLKGNYNEFYAYNLAANSWTTLEPLPRGSANKKARDGASLAYFNGSIYVQKGGNTLELWKYSIAEDRWVQMENVPVGGGKKVKTGGALVGLPDANAFFQLKGNNTLEYRAYMQSGFGGTTPSSWQPVPPGPNEFLIALAREKSSPIWNGPGDRLAYCRADSAGALQVFSAKYDGTNEVQLTFLNGSCDRPAWSPNDSFLTFAFEPAGSPYSQVCVVPASGGTVTVATSDSADHFNPAWWDDSTLIYERDDELTGYTQLYRVAASGGSEVRLSSSAFDHTQPQPVSPWIVIFQGEDADGDAQLFRYQICAACTLEAQITSLPLDHENPRVARNAGVVTYQMLITTAAAGATYQIGKVSIWGGTEQTLTWSNRDLEYPSITSGAEVIHCAKRGDPEDAICQVNPDGYGWWAITDEKAQRDRPSSAINALCGTTACYEREDGIYRTASSTGSGGGQSASTSMLAVDGLMPNPAKGLVKIMWHVRRESHVSLKMYDITGTVVNALIDQKVKPGSYVTVWNRNDTRGRRLANGIYFCSLESEDARLNQKVVLTD